MESTQHEWYHPEARANVKFVRFGATVALVTRTSRSGEVTAASAPLPAPAPEAGPAVVPASADQTFWGVAFAWMLVGAVTGGVILYLRNPTPFIPVAGIGAFAPLYVLAQAIERILEPVNHFLQPGGDKPAAVAKRDYAVAEAITSPHPSDLGLTDAEKTANVGTRVAAAAAAQTELDALRANRAAISWGLASFFAMIGCGYFGVGLLQSIGETGVSRYVDMVVTGLAVGAGTKPLHDFISNLQGSAQAKRTPAAAGGTV